ncbi:DNA polymerase III subunit beta [Atribacter laminatus]|uniref:Beta sliding clamp n=2 Tax=Atribacter laminatus TaxID=2847778 RepID=A0A7T1F2R6_ATRLM|nr:DNA polymerase III subunit beta [Atribacter laminatus]
MWIITKQEDNSMKATVKLRDLKKAIDHVSVCVPSRSSIPVLTGLLIEAENKETIKMLSNDMEMGIIAKCQANVEESTSVVLPGKLLIGITRGMVGETVTINSLSDSMVTELRCGKSIFKLTGYPPENFPVFPPFQKDKYFTVKSEQLRIGYNKTAFATSNDETRGPLTGVLLEGKESFLYLAATDGHRLSLHKIEKINDQVGEKIRFIVPSKVAAAIIRAMVGERVNVIPGQGEIMFDMDSVIIYSRLIEGEFPEYESVLPTDFTTTATVNRKELFEGIERVALVTTPEEETIYLQFSDGKLIMTCESQGMGTAREEMEVTIEGQAVNIAFNSRFLTECIRVAPWENISLGINGEVAPVLIFGDNDEFRHLIMPLKVREEV